MTTEISKTKQRRPRSTYSESLALRVCKVIATSSVGIKRMVADDMSLPSESTIYLWILNNPRFADAYKEAREKQADIRRQACQAIAETCLDEVRALVEARRPDAAALAKALVAATNLVIQVQFRLAAWMAPKPSGSSDGEGKWRGRGVPFVCPADLNELIG